MPTYQYLCNDCRDLEIVQKFTDATLTVCPNCQGDLRKVFNAVGVVFKGSGFYRTDSRSASDSKAAQESKTGDVAAKKNDTGNDKGSESKPAKTETSVKSDKTPAVSSGSSTGSKAASS